MRLGAEGLTIRQWQKNKTGSNLFLFGGEDFTANTGGAGLGRPSGFYWLRSATLVCQGAADTKGSHSHRGAEQPFSLR